jgi:putative membrane protein
MGFLIRVILNVLVSTAAIWVADRLIDDVTLSSVLWEALAVGLIFGVINAVLKPIVKLLSLPVIIVTMGLFTLVINTLLLMLVDTIAGDWLSVGSFIDAFLASIVISIVIWVLNLIIPD